MHLLGCILRGDLGGAQCTSSTISVETDENGRGLALIMLSPRRHSIEQFALSEVRKCYRFL